MSNIPDIRSFYKPKLYENTKGASKEREINNYYQGYLNDKDAEYLAGYDFAIDEIIRNFFFNLDIRFDELEDCGFDDQRVSNFNRHYREYLDTIDEGEDFDFESVEDTQIRLLLIVIDALFDNAESFRDGLGVSMLDSLSDEEYAEQVDKYKAGYRNVLVSDDEPEE